MSVARIIERISQVLVFLFPLFAVLINSWASSIFILLSLVSFYHFKPSKVSPPQTVWINRGFALFFLVFAIKATLLGWQKPEIKALGTEILFLLAFPLAHMAYRVPHLKRILLHSFSVSLAILCIWGSYDVFMQHQFRFVGVYSPLRVAALAVLISLISVVHYYQKKRTLFAILHYLAGAYVLYLSHGRMAMISFLALSIILAIILLPSMKQKVFVAIFVLVAAGAGLSVSQSWSERLVGETKQLVNYINNPNSYPKDRPHGSWITHYMMLEASAMLFKEHPLLGVGRNHYKQHIKTLAQKQRVNVELANPRHYTPHNLLAEIAVSKGLLGILSFLFLSCAILLRSLKSDQKDLGALITIATIWLIGIGEPIWVLSNTFISFFVLVTILLTQPSKTNHEN